MPRDKKTIHRATSDIEDEEIDSDPPTVTLHSSPEKITNRPDNNILEERKIILKNAILKRTMQLKQQREKNKQQRVNSTHQSMVPSPLTRLSRP
jgi:hypothetical protein